MHPELRACIGPHRSAAELKSVAERLGMISLRAAGAEAVRLGVTTAEEVARVIDAGEDEPS